MPNAAPRRSGGNTSVTMTRVCGISIAAPAPWTARNAISQPTPGANAHAAEATVKTAIPAVNIVLVPRMSPSRPQVITSTASASA